MKNTLYIFLIVLCSSFSWNKPKTITDYESDLSSIAYKFKNNIMDEDICKSVSSTASTLVRTIEDDISDNGKSYSAEDLQKLKKQLIEAEALEEYITCVGDVGSGFPTVEQFTIANKRIGASITATSTDKFCIDFVKVSIGTYSVYLAYNKTAKNYKFDYKWACNTGTNYGNGNAAVMKNSYRNTINNRDTQKITAVYFSSVACTEF